MNSRFFLWKYLFFATTSNFWWSVFKSVKTERGESKFKNWNPDKLEVLKKVNNKNFCSPAHRFTCCPATPVSANVKLDSRRKQLDHRVSRLVSQFELLFRLSLETITKPNAKQFCVSINIKNRFAKSAFANRLPFLSVSTKKRSSYGTLPRLHSRRRRSPGARRG